VFRKNTNKLEFLCLKPNPEPGRNSSYYVVTGSIEKGETKEEAVSREVFEETGKSPTLIINLDNTIRYTDHITKEKFVEYCYGAQIDQDVKALSVEHIDFKWVDADQFINTIWWDEDKAILKKMVTTLLEK